MVVTRVFRSCLLIELGPICISMIASLWLKSCEDHSLLKSYNGGLWKNNYRSVSSRQCTSNCRKQSTLVYILSAIKICDAPAVRVKSGIFGQTAKFGQPPCLFHSSVIGMKNKLTKQTVKILMRRLIRSRLIWISTVCKCVSEFTWCPNLPDFTLNRADIF